METFPRARVSVCLTARARAAIGPVYTSELHVCARIAWLTEWGVIEDTLEWRVETEKGEERRLEGVGRSHPPFEYYCGAGYGRVRMGYINGWRLCGDQLSS